MQQRSEAAESLNHEGHWVGTRYLGALHQFNGYLRGYLHLYNSSEYHSFGAISVKDRSQSWLGNFAISPQILTGTYYCAGTPSNNEKGGSHEICNWRARHRTKKRSGHAKPDQVNPLPKLESSRRKHSARRPMRQSSRWTFTGCF